jgi:hypothetical protein
MGCQLQEVLKKAMESGERNAERSDKSFLVTSLDAKK